MITESLSFQNLLALFQLRQESDIFLRIGFKIGFYLPIANQKRKLISKVMLGIIQISNSLPDSLPSDLGQTRALKHLKYSWKTLCQEQKLSPLEQFLIGSLSEVEASPNLLTKENLLSITDDSRKYSKNLGPAKSELLTQKLRKEVYTYLLAKNFELGA